MTESARIGGAGEPRPEPRGSRGTLSVVMRLPGAGLALVATGFDAWLDA
jgi:hypothetical protein